MMPDLPENIFSQTGVAVGICLLGGYVFIKYILPHFAKQSSDDRAEFSQQMKEERADCQKREARIMTLVDKTLDSLSPLTLAINNLNQTCTNLQSEVQQAHHDQRASAAFQKGEHKHILDDLDTIKEMR